MRIHIGTLLLIFVQALAGEDSQFRVHVVDPLHAGVNAARVDLISERESRTAATDVDGIANFVNLRPDKYKVRVSAPGFKFWVRDEDSTAEQERPLLVRLRPGVLDCERHYWIEYDNRPGSPLRGVVVDAESHEGIRGVKMQLRLPGEKNPVITLRSQKTGTFRGAANRTWTIQALGDR